jgi:hypothetical protein
MKYAASRARVLDLLRKPLLLLVIAKPVRYSWLPPMITILRFFEILRPPDEAIVFPSPRYAPGSPVTSISSISTTSAVSIRLASIRLAFLSSPS